MTRKQILTFFAMGLGIFAVALDITSINVAIPAIQKSFNVDVDTVQWLVNGYILSFGVLMVTFGRLADMFGRRKIFFIGLFIFSLASLAGTVSVNASMIIAARVVQGVGAAMIWPCIIGILYSAVSGDQKSLAGGLIMVVAGIGNAIGPLIGGVLTEYISWRWVLFINIPVALIAGIITYLEVDEEVLDGGKTDIDYTGIVTISVSLVALLYALTVSPSWGWLSYKTISLLIIFVIVMGVFLIIERSKPEGLIPRDVLGNSQFTIICIMMFTFVPGFFAILLYITQYLEKFLDYSPIQAGAVLVPMLIVYSGTSAVSPKIYNKLGARFSIFVGMLLCCLGELLIVFLGFGSNFYGLIPGYIVAGIGLGFAVPSITTAGVSAVSEARGSLAGGILFMYELVGGAFGLAVATTIFTDFAKNDLLSRLSESALTVSESQKSQILDFVTGSGTKQGVLDSLGQEKFAEIFTHVHHSYVLGVSGGLIFTALLSGLGAIIAILFIKSKVAQSNT